MTQNFIKLHDEQFYRRVHHVLTNVASHTEPLNSRYPQKQFIALAVRPRPPQRDERINSTDPTENLQIATKISLLTEGPSE